MHPQRTERECVARPLATCSRAEAVGDKRFLNPHRYAAKVRRVEYSRSNLHPRIRSGRSASVSQTTRHLFAGGGGRPYRFLSPAAAPGMSGE